MKKGVEKFPLWGQILYSSGYVGFTIADRIWVSFMLYFYLPPKPPEGIPVESWMPELISNKTFWGFLTVGGLVMVFGRIIDAFADPYIGYLSDKSESKIGRRKVFLLYGGLPLMVATVLLFFPPAGATQTVNALYMALMLGILLFFFTVYALPWLALIPELSHTDKERVNLVTIQAVFALVGVIIVMVFGYMLWGHFEGMGYGKVAALRLMIIVLCVLGLAFLYLAVIPINEKRYCDSVPTHVGLLTTLKETFRNRAFVTYIIGILCFWFGLNIVSQASLYYVTVLLGKEVEFTGTIFAILFGVAMVFFPVVNIACRFIKKKSVMVIGLATFAVCNASLYFLGSKAFVIPVEYQPLVIFGIMGIPTSILLLLPNAMLGDIAEYDAAKAGAHREAMVFSAQGFLIKLNLGISAMVLAYLFSEFGKDFAEPMGIKLSGPVAAMVCIIGIVSYLLYPEKNVMDVIEDYRAKRYK